MGRGHHTPKPVVGQGQRPYVISILENVQRRMADWHVAHAETWAELVETHDRFVADYNYQVHWAHRDRQDVRRSPAEVLGWVQGVQRDPTELHRVFYAMRFARTLNKLGYVRFRHWRVYGETLLLEFSDAPLAQYSVMYESDRLHLRNITPRQLFETQYRSPQRALWAMGDGKWLKVLRAPRTARRPPQQTRAVQRDLFTRELQR